MKLDGLLITLDAVLDALPDDVDPDHPERLQFLRELVRLLITLQKFI